MVTSRRNPDHITV